ncbi:MAG: hypothetical protein ABID38_03915 [Candidatus Diapherotrites archaeon]
MFPLFMEGFFELLGDLDLILKIFVLMTIYSFAKNHLGNNFLAIIIVGAFTYFIFFSGLWFIFGGIYLLYMLLTFGIAGIMIDYFFVGGGQTAGEGNESPVSSGADVAKRMASQRARQGPAQRRVFGGK